MTREELIAMNDAYVRNSAIDAFTNLRLNIILRNLITGGITGTYATYNDFKAAILANREAGEDWYMRARITDTGFIYEYFPDAQTINWTASQTEETI